MLPSVRELYITVFFFQAEDGIRDVAVTGVQTCALPILRKFSLAAYSQGVRLGIGQDLSTGAGHATAQVHHGARWRSGWVADRGIGTARLSQDWLGARHRHQRRTARYRCGLTFPHYP